eukprot:scaffold15486_cov60-Phaeocystis_antarctica.AAC.2
MGYKEDLLTRCPSRRPREAADHLHLPLVAGCRRCESPDRPAAGCAGARRVERIWEGVLGVKTILNEQRDSPKRNKTSVQTWCMIHGTGG